MPIVSLKELKAQLPRGKRLMGLDHGTKTIGLALASPEMGMATPLKTLKRTKFTQDLRALAAVCEEYGVGGLVIGLPLNMDGTEGPRVESVRHFADNLLAGAGVLGFTPLIAFCDERLSTHAAEQELIEDFDMSRKKRAEVIDSMAALKILQAALRKMDGV